MRVVEKVNRALHRLLDRHDDLYLLGEDIADPYGGAFRATRGLSDRHPTRVLSTPISESGILGVASGLALCGDRVIVEVMFGDFATLGFDQIVNFATKSVSMYGRRKQLRLIVRCPVGGHRGYGPTHSQSLQKHFIGIPNLTLYELSPWHEPEALVEEAFDRGEPAIIFEPKTLYAQPAGTDAYEFVDAEHNWIRVRACDAGVPDVVIIASGGSANTATTAARALLAEGSRVDVLVPGRLYPLDITPVTGLLAEAGTVCVAEESTAGGTWGTEVARHVNERLWSALDAPVLLLNSRDSVIPAAPHLERRVLLQADDILTAVRTMLTAVRAGPAVTVPRINSNDAVYTLTAWLAANGSRVAAGEPIAEFETSKAIEEIVAEARGVLHHEVPSGATCAPGDVVGRIATSPSPALAGDAPPVVEPVAGLIELTRTQRAVGDVVTASRRDIPDGFAARRVRMDVLDRVTDYGLLEMVVKATGELRTDFPLCFASLIGDGSARLADAAHVSVTLDAGDGLYLPVLRDVQSRSIGELADSLADYRMRAFRGTFTQQQLRGATIAVSWNHEPEVLFVQPVIPPGLACILSVGGALDHLTIDDDGIPRASRVVHLGLAHDHRLVNGREAVRFLGALAAILTDPDRLGKLIAS
jgi:pyruvate/2-oxoglutarate/acetoin dehydrogenase E1 component/pyruvate/2-oxoglutarate dehydrogenase complex dihydrolipoamide acyltransferase (E2) component